MEKKMVKLTLVRTVTHYLEAELTKEEFETLEKHIDDSNGEDGADIMYEMKEDAERQPDKWKDNFEDLRSDWDEE